jgi:predicted DNA-binding protein
MMRYDRIMKRMTVMLPDDIDSRLRIEARRRGVPVAEIVREAVERHLPHSKQGRPLSFFAIAEGTEDASERVDEIVMDALRKKRRRAGR